MAPSADRRLRTGVAVALLAPAALAGCDTTQRQNVRAKLRAEREIASRVPVRVTRAHPQVRVTGVTLLRHGGRPTVVVDLRSSAPRPLTDLPIVVGLRSAAGHETALNRRGGLGWFQTHVPAIPAHGSITWVFSGRRPAAATGRPFARVGLPSAPILTHAASLPAIEAVGAASGGGREGKARVRVRNRSDVPQYGLQVYALARSAGRYVAAGKASLVHLGTGASATVAVALTRRVEPRELRFHAVPTIFE